MTGSALSVERVGRSDVPPNKGVYRGAAQESINVRVKSEELEAIPPELVADPSLLFQHVAWRPQYGLADMVETALAWERRQA